MGIIKWFRDSLSPRDAVLKRPKPTHPKLTDFSRSSYYVFLYRKDQLRNGRVLSEKESGYRHPKSYWGPFDTERQAQEAVRVELEKYGLPRTYYKVRRLMPEAFVKIWGSLPGEASPGY